MSMDLAKKTYTTKPDYLVAGTAIGITTAAKTADGAIDSHVPVILTDAGKVKAMTATSELSSLYGISADSAEDGNDAVVYLSGEFFADGMTFPSGVTAADVEVAYRKMGIFLK